MTPTELKLFMQQTRQEFFAKFPKPSRRGARGFWQATSGMVRNIFEGDGFSPKILANKKIQIEKFLNS